jgi:hypothetical protein
LDRPPAACLFGPSAALLDGPPAACLFGPPAVGQVIGCLFRRATICCPVGWVTGFGSITEKHRRQLKKDRFERGR